MTPLRLSAVRRRLRRSCSGPADDGNAIVEFVYLAVLLMVPLAYVLLTVFAVQSAAFAVSSAAREAGRVFATSSDADLAADRSLAAARLVMADSNLSLSRDQLQVSCSPSPCGLEPGSRVDVVVTYRVPLPFVPRFLLDRAPASVRVTSRHLEVVDRFRAGPR